MRRTAILLKRTCDLCGREAIVRAYEVEGRAVFVCTACEERYILASNSP